MKPKRIKNHRPAGGFTLIELLVVLAVIAILAGMLLPALAKAKAKSQGIACAGNLKQLQIALQIYASDQGGAFPRNIQDSVNRVPGSFWESIDGAWALGNAKADLTDENLRKGVFWNYLKDVKVYKCPGDKSTVKGRPDLGRFRSYAISGWLNSFDGPREQPKAHVATIFKDTESRRPSELFGFLCVNERSIDCAVFGPWHDGVDTFWWCTTPSERHSQGAYLGFVDGHVQYHRWQFTPKLNTGADQALTTARGKQDRNDHRWLLEHSPYWDWPGRKGPILP